MFLKVNSAPVRIGVAPPSKSPACLQCHGAAKGHKAWAIDRARKGFEPDLPVVVARPGPDKCLECHNEESPTWDPARYALKDGQKTGFDFRQAYAKIKHLNPSM